MIDIVDRCCGIAKYRCGVGIYGGRARRRIATGEHGIVDDDARRIQRSPAAVFILVAHGVQVCMAYVVASLIVRTVDGDI